MVGADVPGRPPPAQGRHRWTMRPRGPPRTSAPTNAAQPWRAGPRAPCGAQGRIHGRGGRPRPPAPPPHAQGRRRWTMRPRGPPRTSAPTNAAHHMTRNAAHSRHAQNRTHHVARRTTMRTTHLPMRDLFARLTTESNDMRPFPRRSTQATCHGVPDNIRPFLGIMGLVSYACIKETTLKAKMPRLRQK